MRFIEMVRAVAAFCHGSKVYEGSTQRRLLKKVLVTIGLARTHGTLRISRKTKRQIRAPALYWRPLTKRRDGNRHDSPTADSCPGPAAQRLRIRMLIVFVAQLQGACTGELQRALLLPRWRQGAAARRRGRPCSVRRHGSQLCSIQAAHARFRLELRLLP